MRVCALYTYTYTDDDDDDDDVYTASGQKRIGQGNRVEKHLSQPRLSRSRGLRV